LKQAVLIVVLAVTASGCSTVEQYNLNPMEWFETDFGLIES